MIICYCNKTNFSSSINEVMRPVLNFLFFYDKVLQVQKSTKKIQGTKMHKKALKSTKNTINILVFSRSDFISTKKH